MRKPGAEVKEVVVTTLDELIETKLPAILKRLKSTGVGSNEKSMLFASLLYTLQLLREQFTKEKLPALDLKDHPLILFIKDYIEITGQQGNPFLLYIEQILIFVQEGIFEKMKSYIVGLLPEFNFDEIQTSLFNEVIHNTFRDDKDREIFLNGLKENPTLQSLFLGLKLPAFHAVLRLTDDFDDVMWRGELRRLEADFSKKYNHYIGRLARDRKTQSAVMPESKAPKKILLILLDYDGCVAGKIFTDQYKELNRNLELSPYEYRYQLIEILKLTHHRLLLNDIVAKAEKYDQIVLMIGSNRQTLSVDTSNSDRNENGSCVEMLELLTEIIHEETGKPTIFNPYMLQDSFRELKSGQTAKAAKAKEKEIAAADPKVQQLESMFSKIKNHKYYMLFLQTVMACGSHQNAELGLLFYDDDPAIVKETAEIFAAQSHHFPTQLKCIEGLTQYQDDLLLGCLIAKMDSNRDTSPDQKVEKSDLFLFQKVFTVMSRFSQEWFNTLSSFSNLEGTAKELKIGLSTNSKEQFEAVEKQSECLIGDYLLGRNEVKKAIKQIEDLGQADIETLGGYSLKNRLLDCVGEYRNGGDVRKLVWLFVDPRNRGKISLLGKYAKAGSILASFNTPTMLTEAKQETAKKLQEFEKRYYRGESIETIKKRIEFYDHVVSFFNFLKKEEKEGMNFYQHEHYAKQNFEEISWGAFQDLYRLYKMTAFNKLFDRASVLTYEFGIKDDKFFGLVRTLKTIVYTARTSLSQKCAAGSFKEFLQMPVEGTLQLPSSFGDQEKARFVNACVRAFSADPSKLLSLEVLGGKLKTVRLLSQYFGRALSGQHDVLVDICHSINLPNYSDTPKSDFCLIILMALDGTEEPEKDSHVKMAFDLMHPHIKDARGRNIFTEGLKCFEDRPFYKYMMDEMGAEAVNSNGRSASALFGSSSKPGKTSEGSHSSGRELTK